MFFVIEDQHGEILHQRVLGDDEILSVGLLTEDWLRDNDLRIDHGGHVPLGCGDITATLAEEPGSGVCWDARSYFVR